MKPSFAFSVLVATVALIGSQGQGVELAEAAPPAAASAATSAAPAPSASAQASPDREAVAVADYAWPTEASPEPKEEEWAGATNLGAVTAKMQRGWWGNEPEAVCRQAALREWVRVICAPVQPAGDPVFFGVAWGLAGDLSSVKARFTMADETDRYRKPVDGEIEAVRQKSGVDVTATFQVLPGRATLVSADQMGWDFGYDGGATIFLRAGVLLDVSWAKGEKAPTLAYR